MTALRFVLLISFFIPLTSWAVHTFKKIDTCYHWIDHEYIQTKIEYAKTHNEKLFFWNDEVIYCWRTPLGAQSPWEPYGLGLIRIKFKPDVKIGHDVRLNGDRYKDLQAKGFDVLYSNNDPYQEYTITPSAIESWSIYRPETIKEMEAELKYYNAEVPQEDDVYYAFENFDLPWINKTLGPVIQEHKKRSKIEGRIFGDRKDQHFKTEDHYLWQKYLKTSA